MDLLRAFLPNVTTVSTFPIPSPAEDRKEPTALGVYNGFSRFSKCCKQAMNRTIISFMDPSLTQCKDEANQYVDAWWSNDPQKQRKVISQVRQEYDPTGLPWSSKPQYIEFLRKQRRLAQESMLGR